MPILLEFVSSFGPKKLFEDIQKDKYDKFWDPIIELRLIMEVVTKVFTPELPIHIIPYSLFLDYRAQHLECFEWSTPYGITLSPVYRPPSAAPPYQEVSPSISKVQSFTTPDDLFPPNVVPGSYIPTHPSIDFIDTEVSILSFKSAGSHWSGCPQPSEPRPMDTIPPV